MEYRKDIQVLRGIAVLFVVLFHLQITSFKNGFLGVDIFFVISGFLMAILYIDNDKKLFFKRRIKRLLPAYYVTIILTLIVSIFILTPLEYSQIENQSIFATFFISNIGYWLRDSYFSLEDFNPLLHLWSLGVEIQFYLIIPILYWFFKKSKFYLPFFLILSLIMCAIMVNISSKTAFFITPFRIWEFLIGYLVAKTFTNNGSIKFTNYKSIGLIGLLILFFIPLYKIDETALSFTYGHPGLFALITTLATAMILIFGIPRLIENSKILLLLEILGKYSYSIYLVHFPVIVLYLYKPFSGTILNSQNIEDKIIILTITTILTLLMYHFIEQPLRYSKKITKYLFLATFTIFIIIFTGSSIEKMKYPKEEMNIFNAYFDRDSFRCGKLTRIIHPFEQTCNLTPNIKNPKKSIFLLGNSHADAIKKVFTDVAKKHNVAVYFTISNKTMIRGGMKPKEVIKNALKYNITDITLHYSPYSISTDTIKKLVNLATKHNIKVSYIMPVPTWKKSIPQALYENFENNTTLPMQHINDYKKYNNKFYNEIVKIKNLSIYRVDNILCKPFCKISNSSYKPFYFDTEHLTLTGSKQLKGLFEKIILNIEKNYALK